MSRQLMTETPSYRDVVALPCPASAIERNLDHGQKWQFGTRPGGFS